MVDVLPLIDLSQEEHAGRLREASHHNGIERDFKAGNAVIPRREEGPLLRATVRPRAQAADCPARMAVFFNENNLDEKKISEQFNTLGRLDQPLRFSLGQDLWDCLLLLHL